MSESEDRTEYCDECRQEMEDKPLPHWLSEIAFQLCEIKKTLIKIWDKMPA